MSRERRVNKPVYKGFDEVVANGGEIVKDISRFLHNSEAVYRQDTVLLVSNTFPAKHIVGNLVDGKYVAGSLKHETLVRDATIVVLEPFDKPVKIKVGVAGASEQYVAEFDCTQDVGTSVVNTNCTTFIQEGVNDDIIVEVSGTDPEGLAGRVAVIISSSKLGASTLMPSN